MVEVKQKDKENSDSVVKRFTRQVQKSGVLPKARKRRFRTKDKTKRQKRDDAKYKEKVRTAVEKAKKMGIFDDEKLRDIKKKISEK